jgi:predicted amidophosphoribosyltransferase
MLLKLYFFLLKKFEFILDAFSKRICFFCKFNLGAIICQDCLTDKLSLKQKIIDYQNLDLYFHACEQVFHPRIFYLFDYAKQNSYLIKKAKYFRPHYAVFLAELMAKVFKEEMQAFFLEDAQIFDKSIITKSNKQINLYLSFTPMYKAKEKKRGFNFAQILAREFFQLLNENSILTDSLLLQTNFGLLKANFGKVVFLDDFFQRTKNTRALFNLKAKSRVKELRNSFCVNSKINIKKEDLNFLLIIDDICTTGSTIMELMSLIRNTDLFVDIIGLTLYSRNLQFQAN